LLASRVAGISAVAGVPAVCIFAVTSIPVACVLLSLVFLLSLLLLL
jgi:hypothetical protein